MVQDLLKGIRVLEYGNDIPAPYCAKLLADLGAEVIKIEVPGAGDESRHQGPFPADSPHPERSGLFLYLNTNKMGITLNLRTSLGRKLLKNLLCDADIFIQDASPAEASSLGLAYPELSEVNPRLIMVSITSFGLTGPYRDYKMYPLNVFHSGGEGYTTPISYFYMDRPPLKYGGSVGEYDCGNGAAVAVLGALYGRQHLGVGQHIDVSKQESLIALVRVGTGAYPNSHMVVTRDKLAQSFGGVMECQDGYVDVAAWGEEQWQSIRKCMGEPDWVKDDKFKDHASRVENNYELNENLQAWIRQYTRHDLYYRGQACGCALGPVDQIDEVVHMEQLQFREFFKDIQHPEAGVLSYPTNPYRFLQAGSDTDCPAPLLGQHNEEVYCGWLGYTRAELVKMRQAGVI